MSNMISGSVLKDDESLRVKSFAVQKVSCQFSVILCGNYAYNLMSVLRGMTKSILRILRELHCVF